MPDPIERDGQGLQPLAIRARAVEERRRSFEVAVRGVAHSRWGRAGRVRVSIGHLVSEHAGEHPEPAPKTVTRLADVVRTVETSSPDPVQPCMSRNQLVTSCTHKRHPGRPGQEFPRIEHSRGGSGLRSRGEVRQRRTPTRDSDIAWLPTSAERHIPLLGGRKSCVCGATDSCGLRRGCWRRGRPAPPSGARRPPG
jgi:hypothetical protein